jgi:hypothetical protein
VQVSLDICYRGQRIRATPTGSSFLLAKFEDFTLGKNRKLHIFTRQSNRLSKNYLYIYGPHTSYAYLLSFSSTHHLRSPARAVSPRHQLLQHASRRVCRHSLPFATTATPPGAHLHHVLSITASTTTEGSNNVTERDYDYTAPRFLPLTSLLPLEATRPHTSRGVMTHLPRRYPIPPHDATAGSGRHIFPTCRRASSTSPQRRRRPRPTVRARASRRRRPGIGVLRQPDAPPFPSCAWCGASVGGATSQRDLRPATRRGSTASSTPRRTSLIHLPVALLCLW